VREEMKKKVIFLCLSVLLCTSTFAFGLNRESQLIAILREERMQTKNDRNTSWFSLTFYNLYRIVEPSAKYYIQNPREKLKEILKKLTSDERETLLSEEAFNNVLAAIGADTDFVGRTYEDLIRKEFVRAQIALREEKDFTKEIKFFKMCADISRQSSEKGDKSKSKGSIESENANIVKTAEQKGYAKARANALSFLRQEGTLELADIGVFINNLEKDLSYQSVAEDLERKANTSTNLKQKQTFYEQAAEEYSHYNTLKEREMQTKVIETAKQINKLRSGISTTLTEVATVAGQGNYEAAVEKLNSAIADAKNIGEQSTIADLESKRENYRAAKDLAENIKTAKDLKTLSTFNSQINIELNGYKRLKFLVLKREYELKRDELNKRLTALKNPGSFARLKNIRKSQEEKDEEIRVTEQLLDIAEEKVKGLNIEETPAQRQERERGIRNRVIDEIAGAIRSARSEESRTAEEAIEVAVDRVVLARMVNERASVEKTELEKTEERLDSEISQREKTLSIQTGMEKSAALEVLSKKREEKKRVVKKLEEAKTQASRASDEVRKAEAGLSLVRLTVEKAAKKIDERKSFYKDSKNVDGELQAKSTEFLLKVKAFNAAKARVNVIRKVSLQTEGMEEIYEEAERIADKEETVTP
jgi:hypothetical protein